jgi:hypothetical protein
VLDAVDYDAHLFTDQETGEDAVVYRDDPTGTRLVRQRTVRPPQVQTLPPLPTDTRRAPTFTAVEARLRLSHDGLPHIFFTDRGTVSTGGTMATAA